MSFSRLFRVIESNLSDRENAKELYKLYNIGNNKSVKLLDFIEQIEQNFNTTAIKQMLPMQPGDVEKTWANIHTFVKDFNYKPKTSIEEGVLQYVNWFKNYYNV